MSKFGALFSICVFLCIPSLQANAQGGAWVNQADEPVIYSTNYWRSGAVIPPLNGVPAGAVVTSTSLKWDYANKPSGIEAKVCLGSKCGFTTSRLDINDSYWNGASANQSVQFSFWVPEPTTHALNPPIYPSIQSQVIVNYSF